METKPLGRDNNEDYGGTGSVSRHRRSKSGYAMLIFDLFLRLL